MRMVIKNRFVELSKSIFKSKYKFKFGGYDGFGIGYNFNYLQIKFGKFI